MLAMQRRSGGTGPLDAPYGWCTVVTFTTSQGVLPKTIVAGTLVPAISRSGTNTGMPASLSMLRLPSGASTGCAMYSPASHAACGVHVQALLGSAVCSYLSSAHSC